MRGFRRVYLDCQRRNRKNRLPPDQRTARILLCRQRKHHQSHPHGQHNHRNQNEEHRRRRGDLASYPHPGTAHQGRHRLQSKQRTPR